MPNGAIYTRAADLCRILCVARRLAIYSARGPAVSSTAACLVGSFAFASASAFLITPLLCPHGLNELLLLGAFDAFTFFPDLDFFAAPVWSPLPVPSKTTNVELLTCWPAAKFSFNLAIL